MSAAVARATARAVPAVPAPAVAGDLPRVVGGCPEFLVASIRRAVRADGGWQQVADRVGEVLRGRLPSPGILSAGQLAGDPAGYQTHLLHVEPDGSFSVTVMVWLPGQETPVHDHLTWCVTAVMQGSEYEEIFAPAPDGSGLQVIARNHNQVGAVGAFAPPGDIHRVRNDGIGVAVSMHVYGTDISRVGSSIRREYAVLSRGTPTSPSCPKARRRRRRASSLPDSRLITATGGPGGPRSLLPGTKGLPGDG